MFAVFVILPQFCLILLGYLLTRRPPFAKKDFWIVTEKLVFYVLFPPLIFLSVAKANLQIGQCSYFLLISISAMSVAVITAWLANFLIKESPWTKWSIFHCLLGTYQQRHRNCRAGSCLKTERLRKQRQKKKFPRCCFV